MNSKMVEAALAALRDPEFGKSFLAEREARIARQKAFAESDVFLRMVAAMRDNPVYVSVSSEHALYFPDEVRASAGWDFATKEDVEQFFNVISDYNAPTVALESHDEDDDCPFENRQFENHGLAVSIMYGQGTAISVSNLAPVPD